MARKLRVQFPGAVYHVLNRGDRREPVFKDDTDRRCFLDTLTDTTAKTGWQLHAYCLMPNHFHLVLETPQPNLVAGMKWFLGTYTSRFNHRHKLCGHLFSGRYKALVVDASTPGYLHTVCDYVHLNPVRASLLQPEEPLSAYPWSSYPDYLKVPARRPGWLRVDRLLGEYRLANDDAQGRKQFAEAMEERRRRDEPGEWQQVRRGWFLGASESKDRLLEQMALGESGQAGGDLGRETDAQKAERIVVEELAKRGWTEADLAGRRKTDVAKVDLARRLRQDTVMTLEWVAKRLRMGCRHTVANCLRSAKLSNNRD